MRFAFLTSTPRSVHLGSGTYVGMDTLARGLEFEGVRIDWFAPARPLGFHTLERIWFNETLRGRDFRSYDVVCGFDLDGYRIAGRTGTPYLASIKGVLADEARHERGAVGASMRLQARCEGIHVRRAPAVITTSEYAAARIHELYGAKVSAIVPEPLDLERWNELLRAGPAGRRPEAFVVLCVCRLYPRKRVDVLLRAAALLRERIPELELRIVGDGPEESRLRRLAGELGVAPVWLGYQAPAQLARQYLACDVMCLPSVQEGFGIVLLEAMASGRAIVAARAAAIPEVIPQGELATPEDDASLAERLYALRCDPARRAALAREGLVRVAQYDSHIVARRFLSAVSAIFKR